jgi:hypothetical protein
MPGKRILQLIVHSLLMIVSAFSAFGYLRGYRGDVWDILLGTFLVFAVVALASSLKLNWLLLNEQKVHVHVPPTGSVHFVLIPFSAGIIFFAERLYLSHDDHLSTYQLYAVLPDWLWLPRQVERFEEIGIVNTLPGIYIFLFYVFIFTLIVGIYNFGWFSYRGSEQHAISRRLLWLHIAVGPTLILIIIFLSCQFGVGLFQFIEDLQLDATLLNTWNVGIIFFHVLNLVLLFGFALWVLMDAIRIWKSRLTILPGQFDDPQQ